VIKNTSEIDDGISIVIPAYNEEKSISEVISKLNNTMTKSGLKYELIVVDDGSTDDTSKQVISKEATLVSHHFNKGYGAALKTGIKHAKYNTIIITDADGTYPEESILKLIEYSEGYNMVVGARIGENINIPIIRKPAKWFINRLANYLTGIKIPDLNSGLRLIHKDSIKPFFSILPDGFSFTATITIAMLTNNCEVKFVPIDYFKRQGKSKFRPIHDTLNFLQLVVRTTLYFNPIRIFLPLSFPFFFISFLMVLYRIFYARAFGITTIILIIAGIQLLAIGMIADLINKRLKPFE